MSFLYRVSYLGTAVEQFSEVYISFSILFLVYLCVHLAFFVIIVNREGQSLFLTCIYSAKLSTVLALRKQSRNF